MSRKPLCDDEILEAINRHWQENLYPPSIQYIIDNCCISSKNTVWRALRRLETQGSIVLVGTVKGWKAYAHWAWHALNDRANQLDKLAAEEL